MRAYVNCAGSETEEGVCGLGQGEGECQGGMSILSVELLHTGHHLHK